VCRYVRAASTWISKVIYSTSEERTVLESLPVLVAVGDNVMADSPFFVSPVAVPVLEKLRTMELNSAS